MYQIGRVFLKCTAFVLALQCLIIIPCSSANPVGPFIFYAGRLIVKSTPEELSEAKTALARAKEGKIPDSMLGGVLLDGQVIKRLPDDKFGQPIWLVKSGRFLLGREKITGDLIELISPRLEDGGIDLSMGQKYRIFTVDLDGRFYIWNAVVTRLDNAED